MAWEVAIPTLLLIPLGLYVKSVTAEFGWSRTQFVLIISLAALVYGLSMPFAGYLIDRFGAFRMATVGTVLGCCSYPRDFAEGTFRQLEGFGSYGFPESHAASFAKIAYASAWIKHHHPHVFCAALLNAQPMGFYAPAQVVRDAQQHRVEVRPVCINASRWDCTLERARGRWLAVRYAINPLFDLDSECILKVR